MNHDPHLANDLVIQSLILKIERLTARVEALESGAKERRKRATTEPPSPLDAIKAAPILDRAARMHGCTVAEICGTRGSKRTILARSEAAHECLKAGLSSTATGRVLGGRDHTTVLHLAARHKERLGLNDG